jgi:hypothetical protein
METSDSGRRQPRQRGIRGAGEPGCRVQAVGPRSLRWERVPQVPLISWTFSGNAVLREHLPERDLAGIYWRDALLRDGRLHQLDAGRPSSEWRRVIRAVNTTRLCCDSEILTSQPPSSQERVN